MSYVLTVQASGFTQMPLVPGNQMGIRTLGVEMQKMELIKTDTDVLCIDSTSVKITQTLPVPGNQMRTRTLGVQGGADNKTPPLLHLGAVCICIPSVCQEPPRCPGRQEADWEHLFRGQPPPFDGQGI